MIAKGGEVERFVSVRFCALAAHLGAVEEAHPEQGEPHVALLADALHVVERDGAHRHAVELDAADGHAAPSATTDHARARPASSRCPGAAPPGRTCATSVAPVSTRKRT